MGLCITELVLDVLLCLLDGRRRDARIVAAIDGPAGALASSLRRRQRRAHDGNPGSARETHADVHATAAVRNLRLGLSRGLLRPARRAGAAPASAAAHVAVQ